MGARGIAGCFFCFFLEPRDHLGPAHVGAREIAGCFFFGLKTLLTLQALLNNSTPLHSQPPLKQEHVRLRDALRYAKRSLKEPYDNTERDLLTVMRRSRSTAAVLPPSTGDEEIESAFDINGRLIQVGGGRV